MRIGEPVHRSGNKPARKIKTKEADRPHPIFYVVAEDPKRPHVPDYVHPATMEKHARQKWEVIVNGEPDPKGPSRVGIPGRHEAEPVEELQERMLGHGKFKQED
jgi:hypothetical protein